MTNVTGAAGPSNGRRGERYVANSAFGAEFLNAVYRRNTPVRDRVEERAVILLVEIRVRASELGDRPVEPIARAEVGSDRNGVPLPGMCAGQCPSARGAVDRQPVRQDCPDVDGNLPIPKLAHVEVRRQIVGFRLGVDPAEKDVARCLHEPLTFDDALAMGRDPASPEERFKDRRFRLLQLEEQRVAVIATEQQHDPTLSTDAAYPDHLSRNVHATKTIEEDTTVLRQ